MNDRDDLLVIGDEFLDEVAAALLAAQDELDQAIARRRAAMREHQRRVEQARAELQLDRLEGDDDEPTG